MLVDTVFPCVHMKVTDNASNIKKDFKFFDGGLHSSTKARMKIKLPTCDDKGIFTDDEGTYRKRK